MADAPAGDVPEGSGEPFEAAVNGAGRLGLPVHNVPRQGPPTVPTQNRIATYLHGTARIPARPPVYLVRSEDGSTLGRTAYWPVAKALRRRWVMLGHDPPAVIISRDGR